MSRIVINYPIGHSRNRRGEPHYLRDHLASSRDKAVDLATKFGFRYADGGAVDAVTVAATIALFHDAAKAAPAFQEYLSAIETELPAVKTKHAGPSARAVWEWMIATLMKAFPGLTPNDASRQLEAELSLYEILVPIAGHHSGLGAATACIQAVQSHDQEAARAAMAFMQECKLLPARLSIIQPLGDTQRDMFIRMTSSAAFDADRLDTEAHFRPSAQKRRQSWMESHRIAERFETNQDSFMAGVAGKIRLGEMSPEVAGARAELYHDALAAATGQPGIYRMEAPTGCAKTRAYTAFAARCIRAHKGRIDRIIIALPFTSIIDQTALTLREILEDNGENPAVLEHHSVADIEAIAPDRDTRDSLKLAEENWDAPVILTTFVQVFESLLSNKPRRMRKLHNIARSIIILDEIQALPTGLLETTMDVLRALVEHCGCVVVLSTATQPPYEKRIACLKGMPVREITQRPQHLAAVLRRVRYEVVGSRTMPVTPGQIATMALQERQSLVVLNTPHDATRIYDVMLGAEGLCHLSTRLCPAHRKQVIARIKSDLKDGNPVRLVSTQVIEAGVDLDFPWGARVFGPLGSIVQTAGRVNREGLLRGEDGNPRLGVLTVFHLEDGRSPGAEYETAINILRRLMSRVPRMLGPTGEDLGPDFGDAGFLRHYYSELMGINVDTRNIQALRRQLDFPRVAEEYRLIPEEQISLCIDWEGKGHAALEELLRTPSREQYRQVQQYIVQVRKSREADFVSSGNAILTDSGIYQWIGPYDDTLGVVL